MFLLKGKVILVEMLHLTPECEWTLFVVHFPFFVKNKCSV
jgi:hypothetical protein